MRLKYYFNIYRSILKLALSYMLEYRGNALARSLYSPAYFFVLYAVIFVIFNKTHSIGGWVKDEVVLLFLVFYLMSNIMYFFYYQGGVRNMMWNMVRLGQLDMFLTKPASIQFLTMFSYPSIDILLTSVINIVWLIIMMWKMRFALTLLNLGAFCLIFMICNFITYFITSSYATLSFFMTKSEQVIEVLNKATDFAQYPTSIFPPSVQVIAFSILPIAYMGYIPTAFLLGKGSWDLVWISIMALIVSFIINKWAWKQGLKHYSSVSS